MAAKILVTDYAWPALDIERRILSGPGTELIVAETGEEAELIRLAGPVDAILACWKPVTAAVLDAAPQCRVVCRYGIGLDNIAVDHATKLGILVTNVPDFCLDEVSDHALALLLACARRLIPFARATRGGVWDLKAGRPLHRLRGQTLGLIGHGAIARTLIPKALACGLKVMAYTPRLQANALEPYGRAINDLPTLVGESDFVSVHVPLTPETRGLIDARALRRMKPTAYLINTSRGAVVDEPALVQALTEGWIAGAALDVLTEEPPNRAHPLLGLENVLVTPHAGFYSEEALAELQRKAAGQVSQALRGERPANIVNAAVLRQPNLRAVELHQ